MPFALRAPCKLVKRKRVEPKSTCYSILISGKVGANTAVDAGSGVFLGGADSEGGRWGGGSGRIGRVKGVGSFLGHAGWNLSLVLHCLMLCQLFGNPLLVRSQFFRSSARQLSPAP
jgi:hypothetical protein